MHRRTALTLLAVSSVLAGSTAITGCGGRGDGETEPPTGKDALVLRLIELPGLLPPGGTAAVPPSFSLFGDGRLISVPAGSPAGWPQLREDRVPPDGVQELLRDAAALPDGAAPEGPDAPVLRVVVGSADGQRSVTIPSNDPAARRLRAALAGHAAGPAVPYRPTAVAIIATPADAAEPASPWPLPALTGEPLHGTAAGSTCLVLRGADLDTAQRKLTAAGIGARWRSAGRVWQVAPRPLLPDETGCAAL
jgi:hypothetical protein